MDLKSYLRGLGLGMFVCACIIGLANRSNKISDAEIKARAAKLGMVEEDKGVLSELMSEESDSQAEADTKELVSEEDLNIPEITIVPAGQGDTEKADNNTDQAMASEEAGDKATDTDEKTDNTASENNAKADNSDASAGDNPQLANEEADKAEDKKTDTSESNITENKSIVVTVYPGEGSYTVSKKLANLGLVESADVFDRFLCQNGYDKRLSTGNYSIKVGSSAEKIAKQLTGG